ncbi:hypothetical protein Efla_003193 [Eimeria flavescens]
MGRQEALFVKYERKLRVTRCVRAVPVPARHTMERGLALPFDAIPQDRFRGSAQALGGIEIVVARPMDWCRSFKYGPAASATYTAQGCAALLQTPCSGASVECWAGGDGCTQAILRCCSWQWCIRDVALVGSVAGLANALRFPGLGGPLACTLAPGAEVRVSSRREGAGAEETAIF